MTTLPPYPSYRPSGIDWLGDVPKHWEVRRAKFLLKPVDIRSADGTEELLTVSESDGVVPRSSKSVTMFMAENYTGYKLCWPGDLVINSLWAWHGGLGVSKYHGIISSAYGVYRDAKGELDPDYLNYAIRSAAYDREFQVRSKGIWISRLQLTDESFLGMPLVLPPLDEQRAIADFLDRKDAEITRFIASRRRMIALLEEKKQAIINQAVTRGLDPTVPMKDSGVEWLGEIPAHWDAATLGRCWKVTDCKHVTVPFVPIDDHSVPLASVRQTAGFELDLNQAKHTSSDWYHFLREGGRTPKSGDLVFCRNVNVGDCAVVGDFTDFALGQDVCLLSNIGMSPRFVNYQIRSGATRTHIERLLIGSTFRRINIATIRNLMLLIPPIDEQTAISRELDEVDRATTQQKTRLLHEIELIQEYRMRLISDVVTGKVKVG